MQAQSTMFDIQPKAAHPKRVVRTVYKDERELLNDVLWLYNGGHGVDVDPCYSVGRFQIRSKSGADPRRNRSFRNTDAQRAEMIADAGSVQGWVDKRYRIMKETPR